MREKSLPSGCHVKELNLQALSTDEIAAYEALIPRQFHELLHGMSPYHLAEALPLVIEIEAPDGQCAALALASYHTTFSISELHCTYFNPRYATHSLAERLHDAFEAILASKKSRIVSYRFKVEGAPEEEKMLPFFEQRGWSQPKRYMQVCHFDVWQFDAPWLHRLPPLPPKLTLFPWKELSQSERKTLLHYLEQGRISRWAPPFFEEERLQPLNSIGIKDENEVIGWMITHTFPEAPDTVRYSSLFTYPEFRATGIATHLLSTSIQLQAASPLRWGYFEFELAAVEPSWLAFIEKRLVPYAEKVETIYRISKLLNR